MHDIYTGIMEQYSDAKQRHPGMILLFRVGDFYEAMDSDAETLSKCIGLRLTTRGDVAMVGFPYHLLEKHLHKLLLDGHRVAICDPVTE